MRMCPTPNSGVSESESGQSEVVLTSHDASDLLSVRCDVSGSTLQQFVLQHKDAAGSTKLPVYCYRPGAESETFTLAGAGF